MMLKETCSILSYSWLIVQDRYSISPQIEGKGGNCGPRFNCDLTRLTNCPRGINTLRPQVKQTMPISAPKRATRQSVPPHGCDFLICTTSSIRISVGSIILYATIHLSLRWIRINFDCHDRAKFQNQKICLPGLIRFLELCKLG